MIFSPRESPSDAIQKRVWGFLATLTVRTGGVGNHVGTALPQFPAPPAPSAASPPNPRVIIAFSIEIVFIYGLITRQVMELFQKSDEKRPGKERGAGEMVCAEGIR